jgi:hypothetical protein
MDQTTLEEMLRAGKITPAEVLAHVPLYRLNDTLTCLMRHREENEICKALTDRIAKAALNDFETLRDIYFKHFAPHA